MPKATQTTLEINLKALRNNVAFLQSQLQPATKFLAVVKAFAYGSDAKIIATHLAEQVDYFAVAYTTEGENLRDEGISKPILVLHPLEVNFESCINRCLEPSIYSKKVLLSFIEKAESLQQKQYPIHLKFNTGLNRLGFDLEDINFIKDALSKTNAVNVVSCFSHLAASEDLSERDFTSLQIEKFITIQKEISKAIGYTPMFHQCNTSGILNYPEAHFDMVRSGIGMYGFGNDARFKNHLTPIAQLKTIISQKHYLPKGESLGYNRALVATQDMEIATLPIGHADGITRIYGKGKGFVFINGQKAPIAGNVCMDMIMVDVTNIDCEEGDEVIIFDKEHTAETLAESAGTISYELLTTLSQRIKRVYQR